jgi:hypothetical protein
MTCEAFIMHRFTARLRAKIDLCNEILAPYQAAGSPATLRQLHYQLVIRNATKNTERTYKNLSDLMSNARLAGLVDWEAIEDRVRRPIVPSEFEDLEALGKAALASYRLPRWRGQSHYVEVWCEKYALTRILQPVVEDEFHVLLMPVRGYDSTSDIYDGTGRFLRAAAAEQHTIMLYLGDHDPNGRDMVRDIRARLARHGAHPEINVLALTKAQVAQHRLPPQMAKTSDSHYSAYTLDHGTDSWELDALPSDVLVGLVRKALSNLIDQDALDQVLREEEHDITRFRNAIAQLNHQRKGGRRS